MIETPDINQYQNKSRHIIKIIPAVLLITVITVFITAGSASAYVINFEMPSTVQSGNLLVISGTGTLPAGFTTGMEFYRKIQTGNKKVATVPFTILDGGIWTVYIDTTGWPPGIYTVTILKNSEYSYGSSSTLQKVFTVTENTTGTITENTAAVTESTTTPTAATDTESKTAPEATETAAVTESTAAPENIPAASHTGAGATTATTAGPKGTPLPLWISALALSIAVFRIKTKN